MLHEGEKKGGRGGRVSNPAFPIRNQDLEGQIFFSANAHKSVVNLPARQTF